jgi:hypothetical protein
MALLAQQIRTPAQAMALLAQQVVHNHADHAKSEVKRYTIYTVCSVLILEKI